MIIGVVSDTHNNLKNVEKIIEIFNHKRVELVIHTGDITQAKTLKLFNSLKCPLIGVWGNNDRSEVGLKEVCCDLGFSFQEPPMLRKIRDKNIAIFHEPDPINSFIKSNENTIDMIIHGHTHRYRNETIDGIAFFNPGESAGIFEGKNSIGILDTEDLRTERIFF